MKNSRNWPTSCEKSRFFEEFAWKTRQIRCRRIFQKGWGVSRARWLSAHINQCLSVAHRAYNTVMSSKGLDIFAGGSRPRTSRSFLHTSLTLSTQFSFLRTQLSSGCSRQSSGFRNQFVRERNIDSLQYRKYIWKPTDFLTNIQQLLQNGKQKFRIADLSKFKYRYKVSTTSKYSCFRHMWPKLWALPCTGVVLF